MPVKIHMPSHARSLSLFWLNSHLLLSCHVATATAASAPEVLRHVQQLRRGVRSPPDRFARQGRADEGAKALVHTSGLPA